MGVKVAKFGGSSVADKFQIEKLKEIVTADKDRRYVIVSAPGKRFDTDTKMTDILYLCHTHREHNFPYNQLLQVVEDRFTATAANLDTKVNIAKEFDIIRENLEKGCTPDYIASRGEYLSAMLTADFLGFDFVDTQELILFSDNGKMLEEETNKAIKECLDKHEYAVLPGFYGSYKSSGNVKTFSRGGSDITGAVVARAIGAEVYENWTDVSGFLMADPHIVDNPRRIDKISYKELRDKHMMSTERGFVRRILAILEDFDCSFEHIPSGIDTVSVVISNSSIKGRLDDMVDAFRKQLEPDGIECFEDMALIATVGHGMNRRKGVSAKLFGALADANVNLRMIEQGSSEINIIVGVENKDFETAIRAIYNAFA